MNKSLIAACGILCLGAHPVLADVQTIQLPNGDRLTGEIVSETADVLLFKTEYGTLTIPKPKIPAAALAPAQLTEEPSQTAATAPVEEPAPEKGLWNADWSGRTDIGGDITSGNSDTQSLTLEGELAARWEKHRAKLVADYNWETDDDDTTIDNQSLKGTYDYFFAPRWFFQANSAFKKDDIADLNLRSNQGVGLGYQVFESDARNLSLQFGPSWFHEDYATDEDTDAIALNWGLDYDQRVWNNLFQIFHKHELVSPSEDLNAFVFESDTGIRIPLEQGLVASGNVEYDWNNEPAIGTTEEDITYSITLGYEW